MDKSLQIEDNCPTLVPETWLEKLMRFTPASVALALLFGTVSSVGLTQRPDAQIDAVSLDWQRMADNARRAGNLNGAIDALETALAVDPRNRRAYIQLAEIARQQGLQGKAIRLYKEALTLEPTDIDAIAGQGEAMVEKGAMAKAKENLASAQRLCKTNCSAVTKLEAVIAKGPPPVVLTAKDDDADPKVAPTEKP